jgi:hypothetical protein
MPANSRWDLIQRLKGQYTLNAASWFLYEKPKQNTQSFIHYYMMCSASFMMNTTAKDRGTSTVMCRDLLHWTPSKFNYWEIQHVTLKINKMKLRHLRKKY